MNSLAIYNELEYIENYMEFSPGFKFYARDYLLYLDLVFSYDDLITLTDKGVEFLNDFRHMNALDETLADSGIDHNNIEMETMYE
jgi:hypothetical protein